MNTKLVEKIKKNGILLIEEGEKSYYIWPKTNGPYVSSIYVMVKDTRDIKEEFVTDLCADEDFTNRSGPVDQGIVFG